VAAIPATIEQLIREAQPAEFDRCHFIRFGDSCLEFEFAYYVPSGDLVEAFNVRQQVNLSILRKFEQEGIEFAYPTQTLYLEKTT
jgi:small-conductance mechanosensitive channel